MAIRALILAGSAMIVGAVVMLAAHDDAYDFPYLPFDHKAIQYAQHPANDAVARLQKRIDRDNVKLAYDPKWGYLPSLLHELQVNADSQMLVFSKTSFQGPRISPEKPRALYFNDQIAIGSVQGGDVMEFATLDPEQGVIFYTLDIEKTGKPSFMRRTNECLTCHLISGTLNIPGLLVTSVITSTDGTLRFPAGARFTDHRSTLSDRWGGWFVTGLTGEQQHEGNAVAPNPELPGVLDRRNSQNLKSLVGRFDTSRYLAPTSDIVALMTLEHQTRMSNLITRIGWETRIATADGKLDAFQPRLEFVADQLVTYMLFADEAPLHESVQGVSTFTKTFPGRGPRDRQGRSLRDFDLQTRMFKYPLSYMVYSEVFDKMPDPARETVYRKLYDVLSGKDTSDRFARLSSADRQAILEILRDTKPDLPPYFKAATDNPTPGLR